MPINLTIIEIKKISQRNVLVNSLQSQRSLRNIVEFVPSGSVIDGDTHG